MRNTGWVALSLVVSSIASFMSMLVLARLLEPGAFGLVALAWTVLYFVGQIQESGVGAAVIYRRTDVAESAASALVYTAGAGVVLYAISFAAAPFAAYFMHADDLTAVLRVMSLLLVFRSLGVVPGAILERNLDFRSKAIVQLAGTFAQTGIVLGLAFAGAGVWSLVVGNVAGAAVQSAVSWLRVPWWPSPRLASRRVLLELMRYGRFVGASNIFSVIGNTADNIVVGRLLGTTDLGFYAVAYRLADFPNSVIGHIVGRTMFSVYSMLQDDVPAIRRAYVQNLERIALLAVPVSAVLVIAAEPIVLTLLGPKWSSAVTPLRILGVYGLIKSFAAATVEALKGTGKPHVAFVFGVAYGIIVVPALILLTPPLGLAGAALAMLVAMTVTSVPEIVVYARSVELPARDLARALGRPLLCSAVLAAAVGLLVSLNPMSPGRLLVLVAAVGTCVYAAAAALFARSAVVPFWSAWRSARQ